jgi:hypothetical protein
MGNMTLVTLCCRLGVVRRKRRTSFLYIGISWTLAIVYLCCQDEEICSKRVVQCLLEQHLMNTIVIEASSFPL